MVWKGNPNGEHLAPTLVTLIDEIDARAPKRNRKSDGSIGDRAHQSRTSDHNPDSRGVVRALDVTDDPDHFDPDDFAEVLIARRDPRIKYLISDGRVCTSYDSSKGPAWTWRKYTGPNGHFAHLHISTLSSADNDTATWFPAATPAPAPAPEPIEDDDMEEALIKACYAAVGVDVAPKDLAWHLGECMKRDTRAERYDYIKTYVANKVDPNKKRLKLP